MEVQEGNDYQAAKANTWNIVYEFSDTLVLRCAAELGIADIINRHGNPD